MKTCCSPNPTLSLQFHCPVLRLCPQMFGSPSARPREYRLTWSKDYTWIMDPWTISINSGQFSFMNGFDFQQFQHWFLRMRWTWRFWLRTFSPTQRPIPTWQLIALPWSHMKKSQSHWGENLCFPGTWSQSEFNILCWIVFNSTVNTFVFFKLCSCPFSTFVEVNGMEFENISNRVSWKSSFWPQPKCQKWPWSNWAPTWRITHTCHVINAFVVSQL
jgi:hypothetical protein